MRKQRTALIVLWLIYSSCFLITFDSVRAPQDGDYTYNINSSIAIITQYTGSGSDITIPATLGGHTTGVIGSSAFYDCDTLQSVIIPDSITTIESKAFAACDSLTSVTIGSGVTTIAHDVFTDSSSLLTITVDEENNQYTSITGILYNKAITTIIRYPAGKNGAFNLPNSITSIAPSAFAGSHELTSLTLPETISNIQQNACDSCITLTSITFLGLQVPTSVGTNWIQNTPTQLRGHAYETSNFPAPGDTFHGLTMGAYIPVNTPPTPSLPSPANQSTGNPLNITWTITITDADGDLFTWSIHCNNHQTTNATTASNGTKSLTLQGLTTATTYTLWVNTSDPSGSGQWTRHWYTFTTITTVGNPTQLQVFNPTTTTLTLTWNKGSNSDYTMIRRSSTGYPTSPSSGTQAYYGTGTTTTDSSLNSGQQYYYRAWAYTSSTEHYSTGYTSDTDYTLPNAPTILHTENTADDSIFLTWTKGTGGDYTMIRRSTSSYPSSPTSGTQAYYGTSTSTTNDGLPPGTYYYRAWTYDVDSQYYSATYTQDTATITTPSINTPPTLGIPSPTNQTMHTPLLVTWSIAITDPDGDVFIWSIQCSNEQETHETNAINGTKTLTLSNLGYATTYTIWVNTTDPLGSNKSIKSWFTFTTDTKPPNDNTQPTPNISPIASTAAGEPYYSRVNTPLQFNGSSSSDPDGYIIRYDWWFGDNTTATGATPTHIYTKEGNYTVSLTVTDNNEATSHITTYALITSTLNHPPPSPTLTGPTQGTINTEYSFTLHAIDIDNDTIFYTIHWEDNTTDTITQTTPSNTTITAYHIWTTPGIYTITTYTTDTNNASSSTRHHVILINTRYLSTLGYLIDTTNNGTYNAFYSNTTGNHSRIQHANNYTTYLIDTNNDGNLDIKYNSSTGELTALVTEQPPTNETSPISLLSIPIIITTIILIILALLLLPKRKTYPPEQTTLKDTIDPLSNPRNSIAPTLTDNLLKDIRLTFSGQHATDTVVQDIQPPIDSFETRMIKLKETLQTTMDLAKTTTQHNKIQQNNSTIKISDEELNEIRQKIDTLPTDDKESNTQ